MNHRGLRLLLLLTLLALLGTLVQDFRFDNWIARERESAAAMDRDLGSIDVAVADFRAAEAGYVATGQGPEFWMRRGADLAASIGAAIDRLQSSTASTEARTHYEAAASGLAELSTVDRRARDYVASDQRFLASDAIFMDGLAASQRLSNEISAAREAEHSASHTRLTKLSQFRFAMNAATLAFGLVVAFVFFRKAVTLAARTSSASVSSPTADAAASASPPPPAPLEVNLADVAQLCDDLARVLDGRDMPTLLERTARILTAKGLVLWVVDTSGTFLRPLLSHGYPERVMQRLGVLQVDADNMTSLAFRAMQPQTISASSVDACGAIAVPLVTATGCIGVLAAEIKRARPERETLSAARMIAAQLSALAAPMGETAEVRASRG